MSHSSNTDTFYPLVLVIISRRIKFKADLYLGLRKFVIHHAALENQDINECITCSINQHVSRTNGNVSAAQKQKFIVAWNKF